MPIWPTSGRFDAALRAGYEGVTTVEVWRDNALQTLPDGVTPYPIRVIDGTVTVDEGSKVRRQLSLTIGGSQNITFRTKPQTMTTIPLTIPFTVGAVNSVAVDTNYNAVITPDFFSFPGVDLKVYTGPRYTEGDTETPPVGVFRVSSVTKSSYLAAVQLRGEDYSKVLADARFPAPWLTPAGSKIPDEITRMALAALPALTVINLTASGVRTVAATWARERWDAMEALADSIGAEVFFDQVGRLIIRPVPQVIAYMPWVWTVDAGTPTAVMVDLSTTLSLDKVYNAVIASGSAPGVTVSAAVYQASGKFAYTSVNKRPRFYASPMLSTVEQCQQAAASILARSLVFSRQISVTSAPNPALDVGDLVLLVQPSDQAGVTPASEVRILTKITLPLQGGPMGLDTRVAPDATATSDVASLTAPFVPPATVPVGVAPPPNTTAAAVAPNVAPFADAITSRSITQLDRFGAWLKNNGVKGSITEVGWSTTTADSPSWQTLGGKFLAQCKYHNIDTYVYGSDPYFSATSPPLTVYYQSPVNGFAPSFTSATATATTLENALTAGTVGGTAMPFQSMATTNVDNGTVLTNQNIKRTPNEYTIPTDASFAYLQSRGVTKVRISMWHELLQPTFGGTISATQMANYVGVANAAKAHGISLIWVLHNYGRYRDGPAATYIEHVLGDGIYTQAILADLWVQFATQAKAWAAPPFGYELQNEPHDLPGANSTLWEGISNYVGQQIRTVDTTTTLYACGAGWSGVESIPTQHPTPWMTGVAGVVYVGHYYFDTNHGGLYPDTYAAVNTAVTAAGWTVNGGP